MNWARWDAAVRCTSGATAGAQLLLQWALAEYPVSWSGGIYNCRTVRGTQVRSIHGEGRALDVMLPTPSGRAHSEGYSLLRRIGVHGRKLGVQCVIFDRTIYSARSPDGRPYTGVHPHVDHLHIELTRAAGRSLTSERIVSLLGGGQPAEVALGRMLQLRRPYMRGEDVRKVQRRLNIPADGIHGRQTDRAVRRFQRDSGLVVDGIVGPATWGELTA